MISITIDFRTVYSIFNSLPATQQAIIKPLYTEINKYSLLPSIITYKILAIHLRFSLYINIQGRGAWIWRLLFLGYTTITYY